MPRYQYLPFPCDDRFIKIFNKNFDIFVKNFYLKPSEIWSTIWHFHSNPRTDDSIVANKLFETIWMCRQLGNTDMPPNFKIRYRDHIKVKNNNFIRNSAEHVTIDFKMDDGCALSIIGGSLMTLIAVIFIGFVNI